MPTLSYDVQAVLATDKVRFQGQEVAFVVAEDRYSARDALELIEVEYEPLRPGHRRPRGPRPGAPVIRDDIEGKTDNHIFDWEAGDKAACDEVFANADVVVSQDMLYPRVHPAPMETCGSVAEHGQGHRQAHRAGPRPRRRTPTAPSTRWWPGCPSTRSGSSRPTSAAASATRSAIYPGYVLRGRRLDRHRQAGEVGGGPLREPDVHVVRPRLPHARRDRGDQRRQDPRPAGRRARRPRGVQRHRPADQVPGRLLPHLHRQLRPAGRPLQGDRRLHEQGAGRRRVRLLVPDHRGRVPRRADGRLPRRRARRWTRPSCG